MKFAWEVLQDKTQVSTSCRILSLYAPVGVYVYIIYEMAIVCSTG